MGFRASVTLLFILLLISHCAHAVVDDPYIDKNQSVSFAFDKTQGALSTAAAGRLWIWQKEKGGNSQPDYVSRRRDSWICNSASSVETGACPFSSPGGGTSDIKIKFTEKRSRLSVILTLKGQIFNNAIPATGCVTYIGGWPIQSVGYNDCEDGKPYNGRVLDVWLPAAEADRIPTGGVWEASLVLYQFRESTYTRAATWAANITLNITDKNNGAIYLPAFGSATPRVDLNLRTQPLSTAPGGQVSGSATIDTCLYDGYNANSPWLKLSISDLLPAGGRGADIFSLINSANGTSRIDYRVSLNYNGRPQAVNNGQEITLTGVDGALIRPVTLPGIPFPVVCTPTPLTLAVLPFAKASRAAGRYTGTLRLKLSATALAP
ncbi:TPA: pilus assembly protein CblD [Serratia odorifera]|nr:pilus assembly protein CblD [Serratia odorifera]